MSVNRETIAKVLDIPAEQIKCANCARHSEFINDMVWCFECDGAVGANEFCSFYVEDDREEEE